MKTEVAAPNVYTRELTVELTWDEIAADYEKAEKQIVKKIKLPGFRPGKVPRRVIDQQFRPAIEARFIDDAVQQYFLQALRERELTPVNQAQVDKVEFSHGEPLSFKAKFEIEPEIELPDLKKNSLKVTKTVYISDEQDVEEAIRDWRERFAEARTVETGAREGDFLVADLQKLDASGVPLIGAKYDQRYFRIGEGQMSGDNLPRLVGLKPGDTARVALADKEGTAPEPYELKVINVEERVLPEIDADFIKQVDPDAQDEADWRRRVKERIDHNLAHRADEAFQHALMDATIDLVRPEYPPSMVEAYLDRIVEESKSGKTKTPVGGPDEQRLRDAYRPVAERNLKWYLIHQALVKQQGFAVPDSAIEAEIAHLVEHNPEHEKDIHQYYRKPSNRRKLADDLLEKRILEYLGDFAKIKEVKVATKDLRQKSAKE